MEKTNRVCDAAQNIIECASDLHGALSLAGMQEMVGQVCAIRKKAACIIRMEQPQRDPVAGAMADMMNAGGYLYQILKKQADSWEQMDLDEIVNMARSAEILVRRSYAYLDMLAMAEGEKMEDKREQNDNSGAAA